MTLQKKLEAAFQDAIQSGKLNLLARVLRTYAIIDKIRDAEQLFREVVVKPYMNEVNMLFDFPLFVIWCDYKFIELLLFLMKCDCLQSRSQVCTLR
jgi:hypothetical protein